MEDLSISHALQKMSHEGMTHMQLLKYSYTQIFLVMYRWQKKRAR